MRDVLAEIDEDLGPWHRALVDYRSGMERVRAAAAIDDRLRSVSYFSTFCFSTFWSYVGDGVVARLEHHVTHRPTVWSSISVTVTDRLDSRNNIVIFASGDGCDLGSRLFLSAIAEAKALPGWAFAMLCRRNLLVSLDTLKNESILSLIKKLIYR